MTAPELSRPQMDGFVTSTCIAELPPPRDVHEALVALRQVTQHFRSVHDNRAVFPDLYAIITEKVEREILEPRGLFWEPSFIARLAGWFAARYLQTLRWSLRSLRQDCGAWALAYDHAEDESVTPLQHAALGISAHINFDLALGIYNTLVELGADRNTRLIRRFKHDHDRVNVLLEEAFPPAMRRLASIYRCGTSALISRFSLGTATRIAIGTLARWRERVWDNVLALLNTRGEAARQRLFQLMDHQATRTGKLLLATRLGGVLARLPTLRLI